MAWQALERVTVSVVSGRPGWLKLAPPDGVHATPMFLRKSTVWAVRPTYTQPAGEPPPEPVEDASELHGPWGSFTTIHTVADLVAIVEG